MNWITELDRNETPVAYFYCVVAWLRGFCIGATVVASAVMTIVQYMGIRS